MKKIQRTAYWPGPAPVDPADRDGVTVPPEPTPKASTPPAEWPSSEIARQRTV